MQIKENTAEIIPNIKQIVKYPSVTSFILTKTAPAIPANIDITVNIIKTTLS